MHSREKRHLLLCIAFNFNTANSGNIIANLPFFLRCTVCVNTYFVEEMYQIYTEQSKANEISRKHFTFVVFSSLLTSQAHLYTSMYHAIAHYCQSKLYNIYDSQNIHNYFPPAH